MALLLWLTAFDVRQEPHAGIEPVRGWTILSDSMPDALAVIDAAHRADIREVPYAGVTFQTR